MDDLENGAVGDLGNEGGDPQDPSTHFEGNTGDADTPEEYTPNFNYNVKDDEFEFDDRLKGIIRSKEDEDYVRDLYTKSRGLDAYKDKYSELDSRFKETEGKYNQATQHVNQMKEHFSKLGELSRNDFGLFQHQMKIDDQAVLDRAEEILEARTDESKKREYYDKYQGRIDRQKEEQRIAAIQAKADNAELELHNRELQFAMSSDRAKTLSTALNTRMGSENAFMERVHNYGLSKQSIGQYVTPMEAVDHVCKELELFGINTSTPQQEAPAQQPASNNAPKPQTNLGSTGGFAPTKKRAQSIDELRALAAKKIAERENTYR